MNKSFKEWRKSLSNTNQLYVSFVLNMTVWFIFSSLMNFLLWHQDKPILHFVLEAVFMGSFFTIILNWTKIKGLSRRNKT